MKKQQLCFGKVAVYIEASTLCMHIGSIRILMHRPRRIRLRL